MWRHTHIHHKDRIGHLHPIYMYHQIYAASIACTSMTILLWWQYLCLFSSVGTLPSGPPSFWWGSFGSTIFLHLLQLLDLLFQLVPLPLTKCIPCTIWWCCTSPLLCLHYAPHSSTPLPSCSRNSPPESTSPDRTRTWTHKGRSEGYSHRTYPPQSHTFLFLFPEHQLFNLSKSSFFISLSFFSPDLILFIYILYVSNYHSFFFSLPDFKGSNDLGESYYSEDYIDNLLSCFFGLYCFFWKKLSPRNIRHSQKTHFLSVFWPILSTYFDFVVLEIIYSYDWKLPFILFLFFLFFLFFIFSLSSQLFVFSILFFFQLTFYELSFV